MVAHPQDSKTGEGYTLAGIAKFFAVWLALLMIAGAIEALFDHHWLVDGLGDYFSGLCVGYAIWRTPNQQKE